MKKIKKKEKFKIRETWIRLADAEKCPVCGYPFQASMQFISKRIFICLICERYFDKKDNILVEITEESPPE